MEKFPQRFGKQLSSLWESLKMSTRKRLAALGVFGLLLWAVLVLLAREFSNAWTGKVAAAILKFIQLFAQQPMSTAVVFALAIFLILVLSALWNSRKKAHVVPKPPPLSADEKDAIARIRTLWYDEDGQTATDLMLYLLNQVKQELTRWYAGFFHELRTNFGEAKRELEAALNVDDRIPLDKVIEAFNKLFAAYLKTAEVLYGVHQENDVSLFVSPRLKSFQRFRACHKGFRDKLILATNYPGVNNRLKVFAMPGMALESRKFLGEQPWDGEQPPPLDDPVTR